MTSVEQGLRAVRTFPAVAVDDELLEAAGRCSVCGVAGTFPRSGRPLREDFGCQTCGASLRYRCQGHALVELYGHVGASVKELVEGHHLDELAIYEPGIVGPFRRFFRGVDGYVISGFWDDCAPGDERDGVRCEDLHRLSFDDESFDLVISSDIFEHVRDPWRAFVEVHRVLRPGGSHVFTVPLTWPLPATSITRVDYSTGHDVHLAPPVYHGSPTDPAGSLVCTDFGMDLPDALYRVGFHTVVHHGFRSSVTFVSTRRT